MAAESASDVCSLSAAHRWLEEQFDGPALLPTDGAARKEALRLVTRGSAAFSSAGLALLAGRSGR